jgi:hypothetical protein
VRHEAQQRNHYCTGERNDFDPPRRHQIHGALGYLEKLSDGDNSGDRVGEYRYGRVNRSTQSTQCCLWANSNHALSRGGQPRLSFNGSVNIWMRFNSLPDWQRVAAIFHSAVQVNLRSSPPFMCNSRRATQALLRAIFTALAEARGSRDARIRLSFGCALIRLIPP